ncbi:MAG TPA: alpha-amylase family glycosyl hydrolase [Thermoanaerobaculia bacterium]|nr:alpha-amylase family glycosyl hydrolase [Thermoanaerobaculia bacterium]
MPPARYPSLFQINTRVRLAELGQQLGRKATLDDLPDAELDALAADGFDLVWFLGVWQTGEASRRVSRSKAEWLEEFRRALPDLREEDITGSPFAVRAYRVHEDFGGDGALARLRDRLRRRGLRLILDFVPNHVALDHPWVEERPGFFVYGTEQDLLAKPQNWVRRGAGILAYGRDPYFDGWPDTLQLNYANPDLQLAMIAELERIAGRCDGVRCDMAMLVLPEVFERTWGARADPFWPKAIQDVRRGYPAFLFMAEVYWDLEWTLLLQGFDYAYDKRLYDRLERFEAGPVRQHFMAGLDYQDRLARFLENHDEPRAAATFPPDAHRAAAVLTYLTPGLRFFHQGQRAGRKVRIPMHLGRGPSEPVDEVLRAFYDRVLACLRDPAFRDGIWQLLTCRPAWEGNPTADDFIAFSWTSPGDRRRLVAVNYSGHRSQCYVGMGWSDLAGRTWRLADRMGESVYDRAGGDLSERGLYLDVPAWGHHVFDVDPIG